MSQENVEIVKAAFAAWNEGRMDDLRELYDAGAMIVTVPEGWPEPLPTVGADAVMRAWKYQREAFDTDTAEPIGAFTDLGDRVLVRFIWRGAGRGPEVGDEFTGVYTVRKGKIFLVEHFRDYAETLEALGLSE